MMTTKSVIILNGCFTKISQDINYYKYIICVDGAYQNYINQGYVRCEYIIGDLDSLSKEIHIPPQTEIIYTPDQDKTDFEKVLLFLIEKRICDIDIYGATGKEHDHFLGNLSVALQYKEQVNITFYDDYQTFFLAKAHTELINMSGRCISLLPLPYALHVKSVGLKYPLNNCELNFGQFISLRNQIVDDNASLDFTTGDICIFINHSIDQDK